MSRPKVTYLNFPGGRGEAVRPAFTLGGVALDDDRASFAAWEKHKPQTPYCAVPVLEIDGRTVAQSNAIVPVGQLVGLYPTGPWQAALRDEAIDAVTIANQELSGRRGL